MVILALGTVAVADALLATLSGSAYLAVGITAIITSTASTVALCAAMRHLCKYGEDI